MSTDAKKPLPGRVLQPDEISLWRYVTDTVTPVNEKRPPEPDTPFDTMMRQIDLPQTPRPQAPAKRHDPDLREARTKPSHPALGQFDPRRSRQISRGHVEIDAVLDLHGYRQNEALGALKRFLTVSQAQGARYVTVITGKGARERTSVEAEWAGRETGVLRRVVRGWLEAPEFRSLVVSYTTAPRTHGGEGALFVHVRRVNRPARTG
ncbi:MAG: Smr/MutS family protein [Hyphomicrobiaceae bacterium]